MGLSPFTNVFEYLEQVVKIKKSLLQEAFTHPSYLSIDPSAKSFERLEFVGDSVLDVVIAELLYYRIDGNEGILTKLRSVLVRTESLVKIGEKLAVADYLRTHKDYEVVINDIEDCVEAIIGAVFLSKDLNAAREFIFVIFRDLLEEVVNAASSKEGLNRLISSTICEKNPINELQEFCQKNKLPMPKFDLIEKRGEDHDPEFEMECSLLLDNNLINARAVAKKKKEARKIAAKKVLEMVYSYLEEK